MATPSTPIQVDDTFSIAAAGQAPRSGNAPQLFSTPGRSGAPAPRRGQHLAPDLTPVIRNSGTYVDAHLTYNQASKPGIPGLSGGDFMVISPASGSLYGPGGSGGRISTQGTSALGINEGEEHPSGRGLKQRKSHMPLPRTGLPPAKRSGFEGLTSASAPSLAAIGGRNPSTGTCSGRRTPSPNASFSSSSLLNLQISPSTPLSIGSTPRSAAGSEENDGLGALLGECLAMPNYELDESSSLDTSHGSSGRGVGDASAGAESIFKDKKEKLGLAPIELKPDKKFFSFQGSSQYKRAVDAVGPSQRLETIPSPSRVSRVPPSPSGTTSPPPQQYQPMSRGQHGVTEIADKKSVDAIFKAPRTIPGQQPAPNVVSPFKLPHGTGSPMHLDQQSPAQQLFCNDDSDDDNQEDEGNAQNQHQYFLHHTYPVEDRQFSIPSIRLANHVNQSSMHPSDSMADFSVFSEYTYDDDGASIDESYYSFLADDDDTASLSSRGSVDASVRRRRISMMQLRRASSAAAAATGEVSNSGVDQPTQTILRAVSNSAVPTASAEPPAIEQSNSFVEKMQGISIENTAAATPSNFNDIALPPHLSRRSQTFDSEAPLTILNVPAHDNTTMDDDDIDYDNGAAARRRRRRQRGSRRRKKEGDAVEWLHDLQNQSKFGGGTENEASGSQMLIAEAASSKFLIGDGFGSSEMIGGGQLAFAHAPPSSSEDVTKALGMPHPLCRSSTIEAGPFVNRRVVFGSSDVVLGNSNGIALTSSGSGDA